MKKPVKYKKSTSVRLDENHLKYCEANNISQSELIRQGIEAIMAEKNYGELALLRSDLFDVSKNLMRIGGNLNQISHFFNMSGGLKKDELAGVHQEIRDELMDLTKLLKSIQKAI